MGTKKLSLSEVQEIRRLLDEGVLGKELARRYGVSGPHISHIKTGRVRHEGNSNHSVNSEVARRSGR